MSRIARWAIELRAVRTWWQDVLIQAVAGVLAAMAAAAILAFAGKAAGLFDAARAFDPGIFVRFLFGLLVGIAVPVLLAALAAR